MKTFPVSEPKITQFTRTNVQDLHKEALAMLADWAERKGLKISQAGGSLDTFKTTLKFEFAIAGEDAEKKEFAMHAPMFGCKAEDYGRAATINGKHVTLVGFALGRSKYPVRLRTDTGKVFVYAEDVLSKYFHTGRPAAPRLFASVPVATPTNVNPLK